MAVTRRRSVSEVTALAVWLAATLTSACGTAKAEAGSGAAEGLEFDNRTTVGAIHIIVLPPSGDVAMQWTCACNESRLLLWTHRQESGEPTELPAEAGVAIGVSTTASGAEEEQEQRSSESNDVARTERLWSIVLKDLVRDTVYQYKIFANGVYSSTAYFRTWPQGSEWSAELLVLTKSYDFSDILWQNVVNDVQTRNRYAGFINIGTRVRKQSAGEGVPLPSVSAIAGYLPVFSTPSPVATAAGIDTSSTFYYLPDANPGSQESRLWYSFDVSWAHVISYSTDVYFTKRENITSSVYGDQAAQQLLWLEADLRRASSADRRRYRPWIIAFGSRPIYCGSADSACLSDSTKLAELEDLFVRYRVNLVFQADGSAYQRTWPVARGQRAAVSYEENAAPVYVSTNVRSAADVAEAAAADSCLETWCARRFTDEGSSYGRLTIRSPKLLRYEEVVIGGDFEELVIDTLELRMTAAPAPLADYDVVALPNHGGAAVTLSILVPATAVVIGSATAFALCRRRPPYGRGGSDDSSALAAVLKRARRCLKRRDSAIDDDEDGGEGADETSLAVASSSGVAYSALSYGAEVP